MKNVHVISTNKSKEEPKQKWDINTCRYFDIEVGCEREECICANTYYEESKQDIIMELEKDPLLKEFDNRVSKNLYILKNKKTLQDIAENYATDKQNKKASKFYIALESFIAGYELAQKNKN